MLHINDLTYRIGGRVLIDQATVVIPEGHRVGLVGKTGAGKSTLLKLILGELGSEDGAISLPPRARIGVVAQEAPGGPTTLLDFVLAADKERATLMERAETATDPQVIADTHARLAEIGAHTAPARAGSILAGLGFDAEAQAKSLSDFSGGWRMRVALAAVLFTEPDLLLLDEPTNHLDLEAALWLEGFLKVYPRTLLIVSHDRDFLNEAVGHILHLDRGKLTLYRGGYDAFAAKRREQMEQLQAAAAKQAAQRQHIQSFVDRFRAKATKARQAQSRLKMLARMEPIVPIVEDATPTFVFPNPDELSPPLIAIEKASIGYAADRPILKNLNLRLDQDDRIALIGANGNGKTTFAKFLCDRLQALTGEKRQSGKMRVGYFAQHQVDELTLNQNAVWHLRQLLPDMPEDKLRARLASFGFTADKAGTEVGSLSGGEKARLVLCLMTYDAPHLMILDEPTNHLDVEAREALIQALNAFEGAVLLISHDRHLIELTADQLWLVEGGTVQPFDGDLDEYARMLIDRRRNAAGPKGDARDGGANRRDERRAAAEAREKLAPLRRKARDAEALIEKLGKEKTKLDAVLADPKTYGGPADKMTELLKQRAELEKRIGAAEEVWLAASEEIEAAATA